MRFDEGGNYAFHSIKGIRDLFSGLIIVILALMRQRQALAIVLGVGSIIPLTDMVIVLTNPGAIRSAAWIHGATVVIALLLVIIFLNDGDPTLPKAK